MTAADFASGLPAARDYPILAQPPGQASFGENQAFWIHDEASGVQINGHLNSCEDIGAYAQRVAKLSVLFPNGRTLLIRETGAGSDETSVASANLRYRCLEPFRRWSCEFDGVMQDTTITRAYGTGAILDFPRVPVSFRIDTEMAAPAWIQGAFTDGGLGPVEAFIGGERYEQLFRATGRLRVGNDTIDWSGYGDRTHRMGRRDLSVSPIAEPMMGHVWAAAAFPSGAGFGFQTYPTADGGVLWAEGYVVQDGALVAAEVVRAPWLKSYWPAGERIDIALRTRDGELFEIAGETVASFIGMMRPAIRPADQVPLFQSYARYEMRGERAINMIERSLRRSCIETGVGRPQ